MIGRMLEVARHAMRRLRRSPGYSLPIILSLALGIGLNTAVFAILSNVLLRPLPYPHQAELITVGHSYTDPKDPGGPKGPFWDTFPLDIKAWRESRSLASMAMFERMDRVIEG